MLKEFSLKIYNPNAIYIMYDGTSAYDVYGCDVKDEIELNGAEVLKGPIADTPENADKIEAYIEQYNNEITNNGMNENKKKVARINESQLKAIVAESVKKILSEMYSFEPKSNFKAAPFIVDKRTFEAIEKYVKTMYPSVHRDNTIYTYDVIMEEPKYNITFYNEGLKKEIMSAINNKQQ